MLAEGGHHDFLDPVAAECRRFGVGAIRRFSFSARRQVVRAPSVADSGDDFSGCGGRNVLRTLDSCPNGICPATFSPVRFRVGSGSAGRRIATPVGDRSCRGRAGLPARRRGSPDPAEKLDRRSPKEARLFPKAGLLGFWEPQEPGVVFAHRVETGRKMESERARKASRQTSCAHFPASSVSLAGAAGFILSCSPAAAHPQRGGDEPDDGRDHGPKFGLIQV